MSDVQKPYFHELLSNELIRRFYTSQIVIKIRLKKTKNEN